MGDTILKLSENQEENKKIGDVISKLNLFLKNNGLDNNGIDFIKGENKESKEEKEIEEKLEKLKTTQEQIKCLGDFLKTLENKEKNKINNEFNKEKLDYKNLLKQYGITNENEKIDLGEKFKIEDINQVENNEYFKTNLINFKVNIGNYNLFQDKYKNAIEKIKIYNKKNNDELLFKIAIIDENKSQFNKESNQGLKTLFNDLKDEIINSTGALERKIEEIGENFKSYNEKLNSIIKDNGRNKSQEEKYKKEKFSLKKDKEEYIVAKNNIVEKIKNIDKIINNKNITKSELQKIKKIKNELNSYLKKLNENIIKLNILIRTNNKNITNLKNKMLELNKEFKNLIKQQEDETKEKYNEIGKIQEEINEKFENLDELEKIYAKKQKSETKEETKYKIKDMLVKAEKIKNEFVNDTNITNKYNEFVNDTNITNKYNAFINEIKIANIDGEITTNELFKIEKKFKELNKTKEKSINSKEYILANEEEFKKCKDIEIKKAITEYSKLDTTSSKELKRIIQSLEKFEKIRDFYERKFGLDYTGYKNARTKFLNFINNNPKTNIIFSKFNTFDKELYKTYLGKYNKNTINPLIQNAEENGNKAEKRNKALALKDIIDGTKSEMIDKIGNIQTKLKNIKEYLENYRYNKNYKDKIQYVDNLIKKYGTIDPKNSYKILTEDKFGNITINQINEINLISDQLDYIAENKNTDKLDKIKTIENEKKELLNLKTNYLKKVPEEFKKDFEGYFEKIKTMEGEEEINKMNNFLNGAEQLIVLYNKILPKINTNKNFYHLNIAISNILKVPETTIDNTIIKILNNEAINAGLDKKQLNESIGNIEKQLNNKLGKEWLGNNLKDYSNLENLKKENPLVYLKVLGEINKFKVASDLKSALGLWDNIILKKIKSGENLLNLDFGSLVNNSLGDEIKIENKEFKFFEDEKEVLNYLNIETDFPLNKNPKLNRANERKALLILSVIKNDHVGNVKEAKKLLNFAVNNHCLGDIRIINKLRILAGATEKTKNTETIEQLKIERDFKKKDNNFELNLFVGKGEDTYLLANQKNKSSKHELLGKVKLSNFKNNFITALNKGKDYIMPFIQSNPRASMSFFAYLIKKPNTLNLSQQMALFSIYQEVSISLEKVNTYIQKASGENSLMIELRTKFGETGKGKFLKKLENKLRGIIDNKKGDNDLKDLNSIIETKEGKENLIELVKILNFTEDQKNILIKAINNGRLTIEDKKNLENEKIKQESIEESINDILSKFLNKDKNKNKLNTIKNNITSILKNKDEKLNKKENITNNLKNILILLKENKISTDALKEISNLEAIKNIGLNNTFLTIANNLGKNGYKSNEIKNTVEKTIENITQAENTQTVVEKIKKDNNGNITSELINNAVEDSKENFTKIEENNKELLEKILKGEAGNELEVSTAKNDIDLVKTISESKILTKEEKLKVNKKIKSEKIIKNAIKIAKENPEQSEDLRKTLKEYKKELSKKDKSKLSKEEKKTLKRLNSYNLDKPNMPAIVLGKEKNEINKAMEGKDNAEIILGGKAYLATKNINGDLALLDKTNNELLTITNDGLTETIKLTQNEKKTIGNNPEGISNLADFRRMMTELNIADELWDMRETIFTQISNLEPNFKINEKEYLSKSNLIFFLNTILKVTGKETLETSSFSIIKTQFKKENFSNGGITDKKDTNIYGDSEIGAIFIEEYKPRGNIAGFNITKFRKSFKEGLKKKK